MVDLLVSVGVIDSVVEATQAAAVPLHFDARLGRGHDGVLQSPEVAAVLRESSSVQGLRAQLTADAVEVLAQGARQTAVELQAADRSLAARVV